MIRSKHSQSNRGYCLCALLGLMLTALLPSCAVIDHSTRSGLDQHLDATSAHRLAGPFNNAAIDTSVYRKVFNVFAKDTVYNQQELLVSLQPIDKRNLRLILSDQETAIDSIQIKGKYKRGYFKVRRQVSTKFIAGPLLWILAENMVLIGLTNEENLVMVSSGGSGYMFFTAFPIFAAGRGQYHVEYEKSASATFDH